MHDSRVATISKVSRQLARSCRPIGLSHQQLSSKAKSLDSMIFAALAFLGTFGFDQGLLTCSDHPSGPG